MASDCSQEANVADWNRFLEPFLSNVCTMGSATFDTQVPNKLTTPRLSSYVKEFYAASGNVFFVGKIQVLLGKEL